MHFTAYKQQNTCNAIMFSEILDTSYCSGSCTALALIQYLEVFPIKSNCIVMKTISNKGTNPFSVQLTETWKRDIKQNIYSVYTRFFFLLPFLK